MTVRLSDASSVYNDLRLRIGVIADRVTSNAGVGPSTPAPLEVCARMMSRAVHPVHHSNLK
jgi:hypothetical protein